MFKCKFPLSQGLAHPPTRPQAQGLQVSPHSSRVSSQGQAHPPSRTQARGGVQVPPNSYIVHVLFSRVQ
jgi:hypothetical protein